MFRFYDVSEDYIKYLKQFEPKVPNVNYALNSKFVCGIVLNVNGIDYYAPISHTIQKFRTSMLILDKNNNPISSIRFSFMFPALESVLTIKDFNIIKKTDPNYAALLQKEYYFCLKNLNDIKKKALSVYKIGCNVNHPMFTNCCNFILLENNYRNFQVS